MGEREREGDGPRGPFINGDVVDRNADPLAEVVAAGRVAGPHQNARDVVSLNFIDPQRRERRQRNGKKVVRARRE